MITPFLKISTWHLCVFSIAAAFILSTDMLPEPVTQTKELK